MTNGGVDYSFECSGNLDVLREAFISTHDVCIFLYNFFNTFVLIIIEDYKEKEKRNLVNTDAL